jgi:glycosyltransferase involved in cell wall biosynthesis
LSTDEASPKVAILMATRNGAAHLDEQLASLLAQTHRLMDVFASDDGSTDATRGILEEWASRWTKGRFVLIHGPQKGFAENFRSLIVNGAIDADYFAFCDQDDIWEPGKLEEAIAILRDRGSSMPALFGSRTLTMTEDGRAVGYSPLFAKEPSFRNALVQSLAGGNTMVFNRQARQVLARASERSSFVSHDWWAYLLVSGAGGHVHYTPKPLVRYRQHSGNQVGANTSLAARISRFGRLLKGQFWRWSSENIAGLERNADLLTEDARQALDLFRRARKSRFPARLLYLRGSGVYRQTAWGSFGLYLAIVIGRI